jgi:hypothetical protein
VSEDASIRVLEALPRMQNEYGLTKLRKPCVAVLLDLGAADRHQAAWLIAVEVRDSGYDEEVAERVLRRWGKRIGYSEHDAVRPIRNAFLRDGGGQWKYHGIGLTKKPGTWASNVLSPICESVGCPARCPAFMRLAEGLDREGYEAFDEIGWTAFFRKKRRAAAADYYKAICTLEEERRFRPGSPLFTSSRHLATLARRDQRHAKENLELLRAHGLIEYRPGSGSGPHAKDRVAGFVQRAIPVPRLP